MAGAALLLLFDLSKKPITRRSMCWWNALVTSTRHRRRHNIKHKASVKARLILNDSHIDAILSWATILPVNRAKLAVYSHQFLYPSNPILGFYDSPFQSYSIWCSSLQSIPKWLHSIGHHFNSIPTVCRNWSNLARRYLILLFCLLSIWPAVIWLQFLTRAEFKWNGNAVRLIVSALMNQKMAPNQMVPNKIEPFQFELGQIETKIP